jgi:hypothetical protein
MSKMSHYRGQSCSYLKDLEQDGSAPSIFPVVARSCLASIATPSTIEAFAEHPTLTRLMETIASFMQARVTERLVLGNCARSVAAILNSVDSVHADHEGYCGGPLVFRPEELRRIVDYSSPLYKRIRQAVPKTINTDQANAYRMTAEEVVGGLGSEQRHGLGGQEARWRVAFLLRAQAHEHCSQGR